MAGATARIPMSRRILTWDHYQTQVSSESLVNLSGSIFGFLEDEGTPSSPTSSSSSSSPETNRYHKNVDDQDEEDKEELENVEDHRNFWDTQQQQLQLMLFRTSKLESRIRDVTKGGIRELQAAGNVCSCRKPVSGGCRSCLMREICGRLRNSGFNSAICKSKWKDSPEIPSGEHTFLDVVDDSNPKKGEIRVIIELDFRGQFEMARGSEEYNRLVRMLPEVFIGRIDRLLTLIKLLCSAAKKCMKEKKMHMGPWRKHRYMQAKWLRVTERTAATSAVTPLSTTVSKAAVRPRASLLTVDLRDNLHFSTAVAVVVV